jgi:hypothetical protein
VPGLIPSQRMSDRRPTRAPALLLLAALLLALAAEPRPAEAHPQGKDSVDCTVPFDCEIRWEDYTRYDGPRRYAISQWNRLGRIDIAPDRATAIADLHFVDYRACDVPWEGFWTDRTGADAIGFNPCNITSHRFEDPPDPGAVAVHELGHALGLRHPGGMKVSRYWERRSILYHCPRCTPTSTYRAHDIGDYRGMW